MGSSKDSSENSTEYSKAYYRKNREEIAEKKKKRYESDPEYKEEILERARERRHRIALEREERRKKEPKKDPMTPHVFALNVGGIDRKLNMYTAGQLALLVGRKTQTIRLWERNGILPEALYRSMAGDRLYTEFQIRNISRIYDQVVSEFGNKARTRIGQTNFSKLVSEFWGKYPIGVQE